MPVTELLQQPLLLVWPHGGQHRARRNALQAVQSHAAAGADREAVRAAIAAAEEAAQQRHPAGQVLGQA